MESARGVSQANSDGTSDPGGISKHEFLSAANRLSRALDIESESSEQMLAENQNSS
jgi:hypothetical protein